MRYSLILLAMTLGAPLTLPLSVSAQPAEEDSPSSWQVDEGTSLEQPAPEEPALQLELDDAGVGVVPPPPRTLDGYTLVLCRHRHGLLTATRWRRWSFV
jgi:hypothetical protein